MPAGDRLYAKYNAAVDDKPESYTYYLEDLSATFENYAPVLYGDNLKHDFMTVVAVSNKNGTAGASTISGYSNTSGSIVLSQWIDATSLNQYTSRKCGLTGTGNGFTQAEIFASLSALQVQPLADTWTSVKEHRAGYFLLVKLSFLPTFHFHISIMQLLETFKKHFSLIT